MKDNELIAEFMEIPKLSDNGGVLWDYRRTGQAIYGLRSQYLHYDNSWDWLMPVVERIEKIVHVTIKDKHCEIAANAEVAFIGREGDKLKSTYKVIVEFIKWCNKS